MLNPFGQGLTRRDAPILHHVPHDDVSYHHFHLETRDSEGKGNICQGIVSDKLNKGLGCLSSSLRDLFEDDVEIGERTNWAAKA